MLGTQQEMAASVAACVRGLPVVELEGGRAGRVVAAPGRLGGARYFSYWYAGISNTGRPVRNFSVPVFHTYQFQKKIREQTILEEKYQI